MMTSGDTFEHKGHKFRLEILPDDDTTPPWEREDGHGDVSEVRRHPFGCGTKPPKRAGELILYWERGAYRTYDFAAAVRQAKREGWDAEPFDETETAGQRAAKAAMADYHRLRAWCADQWQYVGIAVHLLDDFGDDMGESESLWGIESDCDDYARDVACELAAQILHNVAAQLGKAA